ncbi:MAG: transposase [Chloroflexi bacterium]|uniref:Transposase n=1 Tax=Candidatus Chlorohelix allophototropha TaxID=3003348 RepID=A0A8T7M4X2_9CHLR|nr:transposase [Chloroflexota bacterium]WJW70366.1 transposase [Chloroflexota bacterium L227-S17]
MAIILPPIGSQALRKGRVSEAGSLYFITKNARERINKDWSVEEKMRNGTLVQEGVPEIIFKSLAWLQEKQLIILIAYCLMPDHLHLLFQLGEKDNLASVMKRFGSFTGLEVARKTGKGNLWVEGYYDHVLRTEDEISSITTYIENNPLRAGLVENVEDWLWLSRVG